LWVQKAAAQMAELTVHLLAYWKAARKGRCLVELSAVLIARHLEQMLVVLMAGQTVDLKVN
jgi:hypothetical protein